MSADFPYGNPSNVSGGLYSNVPIPNSHLSEVVCAVPKSDNLILISL